MNSNIFSGTIPALMTPCTADRQPDFDALVHSARDLIAAGMSAVVYCGSMGDWPLLSDEQRMHGVERLVACGARGLMIIPRVLSRTGSAAAQRAHFADILTAAVDLPSVIYNSPYYGYETRADLFFDLRSRFPHLVGFKEFGGLESMRYAGEHITAHDPSLTLMVGVDTQVFHGFVNCGAKGAITGIGNVLPREVLRLVALCEQAARGDVLARQQAQELEAALAVLSSFDEGYDLVLYFKHLMVLQGQAAYTHHFNPSDALSDSQRHFATQQFELFKRWYASWSGRA
jgi:4-hydroxy-tetrahydrodipicolinate synthase